MAVPVRPGIRAAMVWGLDQPRMQFSATVADPSDGLPIIVRRCGAANTRYAKDPAAT